MKSLSDIYMGEVDMVKQAPNVERIKVLGANVIPVSFGTKTLKEAVDAAFEAYAKEYKNAFYVIGSCVGPHPYPLMVRIAIKCHQLLQHQLLIGQLLF